jgi:hypothetical protein
MTGPAGRWAPSSLFATLAPTEATSNTARATKGAAPNQRTRRGAAGAAATGEAVAVARHGFDEAGLVRVVTERVAQFANRSVQPVVDVDESALAPELPCQLLALDDVRGAGDQNGQQGEWLLLEGNPGPIAPAQRAGREIELVVAKPEEAPTGRHRVAEI